jgi:hypothetical protein
MADDLAEPGALVVLGALAIVGDRNEGGNLAVEVFVEIGPRSDRAAT